MVQVAQEAEAFRNYNPPEGTSAADFAIQKETLTAISKAMSDRTLRVDGTLCLPGGWKIVGQEDGLVNVFREDGEKFMMSQGRSPRLIAAAHAEQQVLNELRVPGMGTEVVGDASIGSSFEVREGPRFSELSPEQKLGNIATQKLEASRLRLRSIR